MRTKFTCSTSLWAAVLLFNVVLETTAGTASNWRQKRQAKEVVDPTCLPTRIENVRGISQATRITVGWKNFRVTEKCTRHGAKYSIVVAWTPSGEELKEEEIDWHRDHYVVTGLKPYRSVDIKVWLRYADENGDKHDGDPGILRTWTAVDKPSLPKNVKISNIGDKQVTAVWDPPDVLNGPLDGYIYKVCSVKACDDVPGTGCSHARYTNQMSFTVTAVEPLERYWVWLAGFNTVTTKQEKDKKVVGDYAPFCFRMPPPALQPARDLDVKCTPSPNTVTVTWKLPLDQRDIPEGYKVEITGGLAGLRKVTHEVDIKTACQGEECKYSVGGGRGGERYTLTLFPHYKDVEAFGEHIDQRECLMPESEPPPPTKNIKLVDDPSLNKTQQAFELPTNMFSEENGPIRSAEWLIAQDSQIDKCDAPVSWKEAHSQDPIRCYAVKYDIEAVAACKPVAGVIRYVVGTEKECEGPECNGQLSVGVKYGIKVRVYNSVGHVDSKPAFFTAGSPVSLQPARDLDVKCTPSPNTVTVTWKLPLDQRDIPEGYKVEITGGLAGLPKVTHEVDIKTACQGEECKYSVGGGRGGESYTLTLFPHYEDVDAFGEHIDQRECIMPESEPPPPTKEIKLVDDSSLNKTQQAFELPTNMFSEENGRIGSTEWLIAQDSQIDKCGAPVTWKEAHSQDPIRCYAVKYGIEPAAACKPVGDVIRCVIGTEKECEGPKCNGQLNVGVKYGIKVRVYNSVGHVDSKPAFFTAGSPVPDSSGEISGSFILIFAVMLLNVLMMKTN